VTRKARGDPWCQSHDKQPNAAQTALSEIEIRQNSRPRVFKYEPSQADLKREGEQHPHHAHNRELSPRDRSDPVDERLSDDQDQQRTREHRDLASGEIADPRFEDKPPRDSVGSLDGKNYKSQTANARRKHRDTITGCSPASLISRFGSWSVAVQCRNQRRSEKM
jgi:hypothetical protein